MQISNLGSLFGRRVVLAFAAAATLTALAGPAEAGDCRNVKFHFHNQMDSKIKVRGVEVAGNDGTWTEDIANEEMTTGAHYTTDGRTMNQLDSGATPTSMTVKYDKWDSANGQWLNNKTKRFTNRGECYDGRTYNFVMQ